jgi:hypothetical protein
VQEIGPIDSRLAGTGEFGDFVATGAGKPALQKAAGEISRDPVTPMSQSITRILQGLSIASNREVGHGWDMGQGWDTAANLDSRPRAKRRSRDARQLPGAIYCSRCRL